MGGDMMKRLGFRYADEEPQFSPFETLVRNPTKGGGPQKWGDTDVQNISNLREDSSARSGRINDLMDAMKDQMGESADVLKHYEEHPDVPFSMGAPNARGGREEPGEGGYPVDETNKVGFFPTPHGGPSGPAPISGGMQEEPSPVRPGGMQFGAGRPITRGGSAVPAAGNVGRVPTSRVETSAPALRGPTMAGATDRPPFGFQMLSGAGPEPEAEGPGLPGTGEPPVGIRNFMDWLKRPAVREWQRR